MKTMVWKKVCRWDEQARLLRVFRVMWQRGKVSDGKGYSAKFSFALWLSKYGLLRFQREEGGGTLFSLLGLRFHYERSYGGIHV